MIDEQQIEQLTSAILQEIGGIANVRVIRHCMTRLRLDIRDLQQVHADQLRKVAGVMYVSDTSPLQIVLGSGTVEKVAARMALLSGVREGDEIAAEAAAPLPAKPAPTGLIASLRRVSNIFVPLIPAFIGAGMIGGIASVLTNMLTAGSLAGTGWTTAAAVLNLFKSSLYAYLNIFIGISAARELGGTPYFGGIIGGMMYLPGLAKDVTLPNLFTGGVLAAGQGGIAGVLIGVWLACRIERWLHAHVWNSMDLIITPTMTLLSCGIAMLVIIMPLAGLASDGLVHAISWIITSGGGLAGFLLGAGFLPMVIFGLHQILTPIHVQMIEDTGMTLLLPILAMAGAGQVGACLALYVRCPENQSLRRIIRNSLPVGLLGIAEPLMYGVTLPLFRPFLTACIGGGIGGMVIGMIGGIGSTAIGASGFALIPLIANDRWPAYCLGYLAGCAGGFIATWLFGIPERALHEQPAAKEAK